MLGRKGRGKVATDFFLTPNFGSDISKVLFGNCAKKMQISRVTLSVYGNFREVCKGVPSS